MAKEHRTFKEECSFIERLNKNSFLIKKGFVPNMKVEGIFYINELLEKLMFDELKNWAGTQGIGGFLAGVKQIANVAALPGIVGRSVGLPDVHSGYGFAIGYAWAENKEHCEEYGRMLQADPGKVSARAKKRGLPQVVDEIYDNYAAKKMGVDHLGQVCVMIHSGSRGLGHQVATDALVEMEKAMKRDKIEVNDRQLACARVNSQEGQDYLKGMAAAANYAWVNRSTMTFLTRQAFGKIFESTPDDLDMQVIYDVSHNIAKIEEHILDGVQKTLLVHRKGSTRAFPPHHPLIPVDYQFGYSLFTTPFDRKLTGQPVLIGGTMDTCSRNIDYQEVLNGIKSKGISIRVASPKLVMEEAPESYKNVTDVVNTHHQWHFDNQFLLVSPMNLGCPASID